MTVQTMPHRNDIDEAARKRPDLFRNPSAHGPHTEPRALQTAEPEDRR